MPLLRTVFVWPPSGQRGRPWQDDPDRDALVKVSRAVCDRYSEALPGLELQHVVSQVRIFTDEHVPKLAVGEPMRGVYLGGSGRSAGFETGRIFVAVGFAGWELRAQQEAVLSAVHEIVTTMAAHHDIEGAYAATNDHAGDDVVRSLADDARANVRSCVAMRVD